MTGTLYVADRVRTPAGILGDAIHVVDGSIAAVGRWRDLSVGDAAIVPMAGCTVLPGFRDAHLHPGGLAGQATGLDVSAAGSFADLRDLVRARAGRLPPHSAVVATGFDDEQVAEGRMPTRTDLDAILTARPILIYRHCSHVASANSAALDRAGLEDIATDPPGGRLERSSSGRPTGVLLETAIGLVAGVLEPDIPGPTADQVSRTLNELVSAGITSIDAIVSAGRPMWCGGGNELETLVEAAPSIELDVAVYVMASTPNELRGAAERIADAEGLTFGGWKGFADGSLGGHTALLRSAYADRPEQRGLDRWEPGVMPALAETSFELGGRAAIHAIGDAALEHVVTLAERLRVEPGWVRAEHASVADPSLIQRMAAAGVVASVQPQFIESDGPWLEDRLGPERVRWAYPLASMQAAGVGLLGGSDAPIESPDPLAAYRCATTPSAFWNDEVLGTAVALDLITADDLRIGQPANLAVVEGDIDSGGRVVGTMVRGELVGQERRWGATSDS